MSARGRTTLLCAAGTRIRYRARVRYGAESSASHRIDYLIRRRRLLLFVVVCRQRGLVLSGFFFFIIKPYYFIIARRMVGGWVGASGGGGGGGGEPSRSRARTGTGTRGASPQSYIQTLALSDARGCTLGTSSQRNAFIITARRAFSLVFFSGFPYLAI